MSQPLPLGNRRVEIIEVLRGVAALAVAWHHITSDSKLSWCHLGDFGGRGVEIFFCVSGFILPYAMYAGGFLWPRDIGRFILKRVIRLDPPYFATILICLGVEYLSTRSSEFRGRAFEYSAADLLGHLGYLNSILGFKWVNTVFWTLAIEFQYYLMVAFSYPLIASKNVFVRLSFLGFLLTISPFFAFKYVMFHFPVFVMGIASFQRYCKLSSVMEWWAVLLVSVGMGLGHLGWDHLLAGAFSGILITLCPQSFEAPRAFAYFGRISYSLYLVHGPIGNRVRRLGIRLAGDSMFLQFGVVLVSMTIAVISAHWMWRFVEKPSQLWASKLRYPPVDQVPVVRA